MDRRIHTRAKPAMWFEVFTFVPRVTVFLDEGQELGGTYAVVSRECLELIR